MKFDDVNYNEDDFDLEDYDVLEDEDSDDTECPKCHGGCNYCLMTD